MINQVKPDRSNQISGICQSARQIKIGQYAIFKHVTKYEMYLNNYDQKKKKEVDQSIHDPNELIIDRQIIQVNHSQTNEINQS